MSRIGLNEGIRILFDDNITVHTCSKTQDTSYESQISLRLKIETRAEKEYLFTVTRGDDAQFVYSLCLRRSDYETMKREQDLFIEFGALPKKIIDFICNVAGNDAYLRANFAESQTVMRIDFLGKRDFKWVAVLSLTLRKLLDKDLVIHLVDQVNKLKARVDDGDYLRKCLSNEQEKNKALQNSLLEAERNYKQERERMETELSEITAREAETKQHLTAEIEDLKIDNQMLSQEASNLKEEIVDFRARIDNLMDRNAQFEMQIQLLTDDYNGAITDLQLMEHDKAQLERAVREKDEQKQNNAAKLRALNDTINDLRIENEELRRKLNVIEKERLETTKKHEKAKHIIATLLNERSAGNSVENLHAKRMAELEKDLEERKETINTLTESIAQLHAKVDELKAECEKSRKNAELLEARCERKESLINNLIESRHSPPVTNNVTPPNFISTSTPFQRVLGVSNWTPQITTPLRNATNVIKGVALTKEDYPPNMYMPLTVPQNPPVQPK